MKRTSTKITAKDITELMHKATRHQLSILDKDAIYGPNASFLPNVELHAKTCVYELDVTKTLWLYQSKWTRLIREYIDKKKFNTFVQQARLILEGKQGISAGMIFKEPLRTPRKHKWGNCLIGMVFQ